MIIVNFKNYKTGKAVLALAKKIPKGTIVAVPTVNISEISRKTKLKVFAQHVDCQKKGKTTGFDIPEDVKKSGASGSLLNHSEHKISFKKLKETMEQTRKSKLKIIACASSLSETNKIKKLKPYAIAYEDPKLIGTGRSITKYKSDSVRKFASSLKKTKIIPICGAGISSKEDIKEAKKLGCKGVLVSSTVANSKNPGKFFKK